MYVCGKHAVELGLCIDDLKAMRNKGDCWRLRASFTDGFWKNASSDGFSSENPGRLCRFRLDLL